MKAKFLKSEILLFTTAAIWGFAFVAQRAGMEYVGPFIFNAVRFALGSLVLLPLVIVRQNRHTDSENRIQHLHSNQTGRKPFSRKQFSSKQVLLGGLLLGFVCFMGASFQQVGIVYTTAGKAGFITGFYVILVPIIGLFWKQRPALGAWLGAISAVIGLFLLSMTERFTISLGDSLVLASAFFWAFHVLVIGWLTVKMDSIKLAFMQFATTSILSFIVAFAIEEITFEALLNATIPILYAGFLSVGIAYTLQVVAQREAHPTHAAIILSLESVFAVLGGWLLLGEIIPLRGLLGCALMLAGFFMSQLSRKTENLLQSEGVREF